MGSRSFAASVPARQTCSTSAWIISSIKKGLPSVRAMMSRLSGAIPTPALSLVRERGAGAEQSVEHLLGAVFAQRVEAKLCVVGLAAPLMVVLGARVYQQQHAVPGHTVHQPIKQRPGFAVVPVEGLEL